MVLIKTQKDIEIYTLSLLLAQRIYKLTRDTSCSKDYSLVNQIRRASLSIPANIAEGYGRKSKKDFAHFLSISLGSSNELRTYLDFINLEYQINVVDLQKEYEILTRKIYKFRSYLLIN